MTVSSYETLYESSVAYGIRKALMAEQKKTELDAKIRALRSSKGDLQQQIDNLKTSM
jgi:dynein light intermediate chain, axonemal